jgi:hypothetical protein
VLNQFDFAEDFMSPLAKFAGFFILILGVIWIVYAFYETKRRGSVKKRKVEDWNFDVTRFLKILTYLGFFVGILSLITGVGGLILNQAPSVAYATTTQDAASIFTSWFLIILGLLTFLKPVNDLPIASVIGLLAASAVTVLVALSITEQVGQLIDVFVDRKIFLTVLFIIVFAIVALTAKFYIGGLMKISKAISWPPIAFIIAAFCFLQGFLLLVLGVSITGYF